MYVCASVCVYICMNVFVCVYVCLCVCVCVCVCASVCVYVCVCLILYIKLYNRIGLKTHSQKKFYCNIYHLIHFQNSDFCLYTKNCDLKKQVLELFRNPDIYYIAWSCSFYICSIIGIQTSFSKTIII